jgi:hypothetical protein
VWEERAYRTRGDIAALAASGLGVSDLHAAAIRLINERVSTELACWFTIDPETLVFSGVTNGAQVAPEYERSLAESEYSEGEPHTFAALALRKTPSAKLSDMPECERNRSLRFNNVWRPLGVDEELRVLFLADGACWGAAGMVRAGQDSPTARPSSSPRSRQPSRRPPGWQCAWMRPARRPVAIRRSWL